jgi:hypothetical protein
MTSGETYPYDLSKAMWEVIAARLPVLWLSHGLRRTPRPTAWRR